MFNNQYLTQPNIERINNQIADLEKLKAQMQQPVQPITQNFQLAPSNRDAMKYANNIDEVKKDYVIGDTPYFSRDLSILWIKNTKGEIKTYELEEIIQKDDKDIKIEYLQAQLEELKKEVKKNESYADSNDSITESVKESKSSNVSTTRTTKKK